MAMVERERVAQAVQMAQVETGAQQYPAVMVAEEAAETAAAPMG
jgi:hypothetical protein